MEAIEHLKNLCCLGLPPESTMISATPLLHEIIPHGDTRLALVELNGTKGCTYSENPASSAHLRERVWGLWAIQPAVGHCWVPGFRAVGFGWTSHMQGRGYLESG
jgi:hypothetical protein